MRVAVYTDQRYWRTADGTVHTARAFVGFLGEVARHVDDLVLVGRLDERPGSPAEPVPAGVRFAALPHYEDAADPRALARAFSGSLRRFWRLLEHVDVVWVLGPYPLAVAFAVAARLRRRKVVLGVRQDLPAYIRARRPGRRGALAAALALEAVWRALARGASVVVVGPGLARNYRAAKRVLPIFVSLVHDADVAALPAARAEGGERRLLAVGRLDPEKNPLLLADVLARLNADAPRWRLVVCGDGALREALAARLAETGQAEHAELRGHVPAGAGLWKLYRDSDAFLHVALTEGFPQVLLEAFAAALPVVATDVGGVREGAGAAAELVPAADAGAAVAALERLAADEPRRRARVEAGLELARRHTAGAEAARVAAFLIARS